MSHFICPICKKDLQTDEKSFFCENNHRFDMAKSGYVNLLLSQQPKARRHGDDKRMVRSRGDFLNKGFYRPLLDSILKTVRKYAEPDCSILDSGCGECWYTSKIYEYLVQNHIQPQMLAIDISKDSLAAGAKRNHEIQLAAASVFRLPVKDASCDIVLSFFAPFSSAEFGRVLKDTGVIVRAIPLERHLLGLKAAVYESVYENKVENVAFEEFELLERREIKERIHLDCNEDIMNLFKMTPYYYKTGANDQEKLAQLSALDTEIEFGILTYRKKNCGSFL